MPMVWLHHQDKNAVRFAEGMVGRREKHEENSPWGL